MIQRKDIILILFIDIEIKCAVNTISYTNWNSTCILDFSFSYISIKSKISCRVREAAIAGNGSAHDSNMLHDDFSRILQFVLDGIIDVAIFEDQFPIVSHYFDFPPLNVH